MCFGEQYLVTPYPNSLILTTAGPYTVIMPRSKDWEDEDILELFRDADRPILGTGEVAESTGYETQHASRRLQDLKNRDLLDSHKVGQSIVWWITFEGRQYAEEHA